MCSHSKNGSMRPARTLQVLRDISKGFTVIPFLSLKNACKNSLQRTDVRSII
jgi:hypothetical protein